MDWLQWKGGVDVSLDVSLDASELEGISEEELPPLAVVLPSRIVSRSENIVPLPAVGFQPELDPAMLALAATAAAPCRLLLQVAQFAQARVQILSQFSRPNLVLHASGPQL